MGVLKSFFARGVGNSHIKKFPGGFAGGVWSGLELTDTLTPGITLIWSLTLVNASFEVHLKIPGHQYKNIQVILILCIGFLVICLRAIICLYTIRPWNFMS